MNKYLATDLDGTLLEPKSKDKFVCNENLKAIENFNGNIFIVSGRNPQFIKEVCDELRINHTFISCNGALIFVNGERVFTSHIKHKTILEIINHLNCKYKNYHIIFIHENGELYSLYDNEKLILDHEKEIMTKNPKLAYITNKNSSELFDILNGDNKIVKTNIYLDDNEKYELLNYLESENYDIGISVCNNSLEITSKGITKGTSLKRLTEYLNIDINDVYVIGDDGNDISMFEYSPHSFLVKNDMNKHLLNIAKHDLDYFKEITNYMED